MKKNIANKLVLTVIAAALLLESPVAVLPARAQTAPAAEPTLKGVVGRDPSTIIKFKDEFWVFHTAIGLGSYHSKDLATWERGPRILASAPEWIAAAVPANRGNYWAPDIIHLGDRYLLYYAVSTLGKNVSAIGLASNPTLDPGDPAYHWTDCGMVVQSRAGDDFNALDPAIFHDTNGTLWLSYGSYWSGIKLIQLDPQTGKRIAPDSPVTALAFNKSIEASYLYQHGGYYYLFVNWGSCLAKDKSTYNIRIGRSLKVTGPYVDKQGVDMMSSGGTLFLGPEGKMVGPGHAGIIVDNGTNWFSCHYEYDVGHGGVTDLAVRPLHWDADGWPELDSVLFSPSLAARGISR